MKLALKYMAMFLKSSLEYKSSFILTCLAQLITVSLNSFIVIILMDKFNFLDNFNMHELFISIAIVQFGFSFAECFGRGFDKFSDVIKHGNLDIMLIRPRNIFLLVFGSNIEFTKLSRVIGSITLFIIGVSNLEYDLNLGSYLYLILLLLLASLIFLSLFIFSACFTFKTVEGLEFMNIFTDGSHNFGQYPMSIFRKEVLLFFTFIIPLACVNYYPLDYIFGRKESLLYLVSPLMGLVPFIISVMLFKKCINTYEGTGS